MPKHRRAKPKPKAAINVTFSENGDALIEALRPSGGIEEVSVVKASDVPSIIPGLAVDDDAERNE